MTDDSNSAARVDDAAEELAEVVDEHIEEVSEAVDDAADDAQEEILETVNDAQDEIEEAVDDAAEEVAQATGISEAEARALIAEELDRRLAPAPPQETAPVVVHEETTTVVENSPVDDAPVEADTPPVVSGSIAARYFGPLRRNR